MSKSIKAHPMYSPSDYQYLKGKGYTDAEILAIWDRDQALPWNSGPVVHQPIPDVVGVICGKVGG